MTFIREDEFLRNLAEIFFPPPRLNQFLKKARSVTLIKISLSFFRGGKRNGRSVGIEVDLMF